MDFDIRTFDTAYYSLLDLLQMTGQEFVEEYYINCEADFTQLWDRHFTQINQIDISHIRFIGFHVTSNWDNCAEIRENGLRDLQKVLSEDTALSRLLRSYNIEFDIGQKVIRSNGQPINIDYDMILQVNRFDLSDYEESIKSVAHRVFYDYLVNGFYTNDNIFGYGTGIHERPEFFINLVQLFPSLSEAETFWKKQSKSYKITFFAYFDQLAPFSFDMNNLDDPPFEDWLDLTEEQRAKKQMLWMALDRAFNHSTTEEYMYIKDGTSIPPEQIISYEEISE
jgi:hypothetical protein